MKTIAQNEYSSRGMKLSSPEISLQEEGGRILHSVT
jgi:hypothetical protein